MNTQLENLRNRLKASEKAAEYHRRMFVDVPHNDLERFIKAHEAMMSALESAAEQLTNDGHGSLGAKCHAALALAKT